MGGGELCGVSVGGVGGVGGMDSLGTGWHLASTPAEIDEAAADDAERFAAACEKRLQARFRTFSEHSLLNPACVSRVHYCLHYWYARLVHTPIASGSMRTNTRKHEHARCLHVHRAQVEADMRKLQCACPPTRRLRARCVLAACPLHACCTLAARLLQVLPCDLNASHFVAGGGQQLCGVGLPSAERRLRGAREAPRQADRA
eukprot:5488738-Pleurochrysis_carterae.AAC.1